MALKPDAAHRKDVGKMADMQHRHFATIATIISRLPDGGDDYENDLRGEVAQHFADHLRATNPNFDRSRFLRACGVAEG